MPKFSVSWGKKGVKPADEDEMSEVSEDEDAETTKKTGKEEVEDEEEEKKGDEEKEDGDEEKEDEDDVKVQDTIDPEAQFLKEQGVGPEIGSWGAGTPELRMGAWYFCKALLYLIVSSYVFSFILGENFTDIQPCSMARDHPDLCISKSPTLKCYGIETEACYSKCELEGTPSISWGCSDQLQTGGYDLNGSTVDYTEVPNTDWIWTYTCWTRTLDFTELCTDQLTCAPGPRDNVQVAFLITSLALVGGSLLAMLSGIGWMQFASWEYDQFRSVRGMKNRCLVNIVKRAPKLEQWWLLAFTGTVVFCVFTFQAGGSCDDAKKLSEPDEAYPFFDEAFTNLILLSILMAIIFLVGTFIRKKYGSVVRGELHMPSMEGERDAPCGLACVEARNSSGQQTCKEFFDISKELGLDIPSPFKFCCDCFWCWCLCGECWGILIEAFFKQRHFIGP